MATGNILEIKEEAGRLISKLRGAGDGFAQAIPCGEDSFNGVNWAKLIFIICLASYLPTKPPSLIFPFRELEVTMIGENFRGFGYTQPI